MLIGSVQQLSLIKIRMILQSFIDIFGVRGYWIFGVGGMLIVYVVFISINLRRKDCEHLLLIITLGMIVLGGLVGVGIETMRA